MFNPATGDALGSLELVLTLVATALYAAWLLLMRFIVTRQIRGGTMHADRGRALLRRLNSGVLVLGVGCAIFAAPFSPLQSPNPHVTGIATVLIDAFALAVYAYITLAIRRIR